MAHWGWPELAGEATAVVAEWPRGGREVETIQSETVERDIERGDADFMWERKMVVTEAVA